MNKVLDFFDQHQIEYELFEHQPVYTVEEAAKVLGDLRGVATKNLFLRDDKGKRHFLVTVPDDKRVNLRALESALESKGLGFASADRLKRHLGVEPGSVTLLAVINDPACAVEVIIDKEVWESTDIQCHPLVNTATVITARADVERFLELCGHSFKIIEVPESA